MPGKPQQNGVTGRRNRTLIEMIRSMLINSTVLESLWNEALKITMYILNWVPNKEVLKTPFELWTRRKPGLRHLHVWGRPAKVRIYNPHEKKLDFRTISVYFFGYSEKSKGYRFYRPNHSTRIVEIDNARFIKNGDISGSVETRKIIFEEDRVNVPLSLPSKQVIVPVVINETNNNEQQHDLQPLNNEIDANEPIVEEPQEIKLRRSRREKRSAISDDYVVYLQEFDFHIRTSKDPVSYI